MSVKRLDVKEAAEVLDISSEGVRKRIKRGTLPSEKDADGRVFVWLDVDWTEADSDGTESDADWTGSDAGQTDAHEDKDLLVEILREQADMLRSELEDWKRVVETRDEELRRKDHLLAALTERIPELEAAQEPREPTVSASEERGSSVAPEDQEQPSWWRRFFGFDQQ